MDLEQIVQVEKHHKGLRKYTILVNGKDYIKVHFDHENKTINFINKEQ